MSLKAKMGSVSGVLILVFSIFLFAYQGSNSQEALKFGATYMTMNNPYFEALDENLREVIEGNGDILISRDPLQDQEKQNEQVKMMIEEGIDALFLNPVDWKKVEEVVAMCKAHDIPIFLVDTNVFQQQKKDNIISTIISDNYDAGVQCALDVMQKKEQAKIVIINDANINSIKQRVQGFLDTIAGHEAYEVVENRMITADLESSMKAMDDILKKRRDFDVVFGGNDPVALGALASIQKWSYSTPVLLYGVDGSPDAKAMIQAGHMAGTSAQSPVLIGKVAVSAAYQYLKGGDVQEEIVIPVNLITAENVQNYDLTGWQ